MNNKLRLLKKPVFCFVLVIVCGISGFAQSNTQVYKAELSVPFGEVDGRIITVGSQMVFVDDDKLEFSFAIDKSNVSNVSNDGEIITIATNREVRDRSGMKTRFVVRLFDGNSERLANWLKGRSTFNETADLPNGKTVVARRSMIYEARHDHRLYGNCTGRLIIGDYRISYESSDDREHSRQWLFADVKKLKRNSPYKFEVKLFKGDGYSLEILGSGIDIIDFKTIEDKLAMEKTNR